MRIVRGVVIGCAVTGVFACNGGFEGSDLADATAGDANDDRVIVVVQDGGDVQDGTLKPDAHDGAATGDTGPAFEGGAADGGADAKKDSGGGCAIAGKAYAEGSPNPANACQSCQPSVSATAWSDVSDGTSCGSGNICHAGACVSGCEIAGAFYAATTPNPSDGCQSCQPATSTSAWTNVSDGTGCGNGQVCASGQCGSQCDIGGTIYASGAANPGNACQSCQPGTSTSAWTNDANGTGCGSGKICNAGSCAAGCFVGGTVYASGAANPADACQVCQPATSVAAWTALSDLTTCGGTSICCAATCAACGTLPNHSTAACNGATCTFACTAPYTQCNGGCVNSTASTIVFQFPTVFSKPAALSRGDFNGDGNLDVVAGGNGNGNLNVLLGKGDGTFPTVLGVTNPGHLATSIATADFNGDQVADLAVSDPDGYVNVLLGTGNALYATAVQYPISTSSAPVWVITADFNKDSKADLAVANDASSNVSVLLGKGDGTFAAAVSYGTASGPRSVISADFNGDTKLDLAVAAEGSNKVSILLGNGDGTFQTSVPHATDTGPYSLAAADFNGDGKIDLATANDGSSANDVSVLLGNGNGTFQAHVDYPVGSIPSGITVGDVNGDGKLDLATGNDTGDNVSVLHGTGNGTFQAAVSYPAGTNTQGVVAGDFNGDGKADLAAANEGSNSMSVFLGNACF